MSTVSTSRLPYETTIGTLANKVIKNVENRVDLLGDAYMWVKDSLVEVTSNTDLRDDFDELEVWGTPFSLDGNTPIQEYPFSSLLPTEVDEDGEPVKTINMATLDVMLWMDYPTNKQRIQLGMTHYQDADRGVTPTGGTPSEWYRFGDNIGFNPIPNQNYQVQARILRFHPIDWPDLENTVILLNPDWHEVVMWGGVERGFLQLLEYDKAAAIHNLIHGDPKYPTKVGLLQGAKKRRKKEGFRKTGVMRPIVRAYSNRRGGR